MFRTTQSPQSHVSRLLSHAQILEISGKDSVSFANAQFCSDVSALHELNWQWSAWLDPQGRARGVFALLRPSAECLLAWLPYGSAAGLAGQLSRFVFRSKITLSARDDFALLERDSLQSAAGQLVETDDGWGLRLPGNGGRNAELRRSAGVEPIDHAARDAWRLADIHARLPWIDDAVSAEFTASALGLDRLGAISMNKGCYPGQEIVARLHFRGGNKRGLAVIGIEGDRVPEPGETLHANASEPALGKILYAARSSARVSHALAVLPIDAPTGAGLMLADGMPVVIENGSMPAAS